MTTFSVTRGVGKGFIGDWRDANFTALGRPQRPSLDQDAPRSHSLPSEASVSYLASSDVYARDYASHGRRPSANSSIGYESPPLPPLPDPEVRISTSRDRAPSFSLSSSEDTGSDVSSSTLFPSQSASQAGTTDNYLHPPNFSSRARSPSGSGRRTPISRSTSPAYGSTAQMQNGAPLPSPSIISSSPSMTTTLFDEASQAWDGDLLEVETINGTIRIAFVDEPKDHSRTSTIAMGAARFVKGWLAEKGVNTDRFVGMTREASGWVKGT